MSRHKQKAAPGRNLRLADQIQKDLAIIIQREIDMSRVGMITLSGIDLQLYKLLHIHTVPTLRFFHDPQLKRGIEMSALIDQANLPGQYAGVSDEPEDKP
ncbi:MAG: ribosome-binding factor A [Burkholderiales bacterium]|nr:ribosome-binding factor A [Burkholderiales bacterium]